MPNQADFMTQTYSLAQDKLQKLAGNTPLNIHPLARPSTIAGGFLPAGAKYIARRQDQGRDGITNPGGPIIANGNGVVVRNGNDPAGFGPRYPIVHFTSGPYAGKTIYFGHTLSSVQPGQQVQAGQTISHTGTSGVGNATVPGWFEIGYAAGGTPGPFGQPAPF
jgi:murein DD-endopeptidase MepM/ murein hydrolase activator NlpD